jgi:hypothetical protein
LWVLGFVGSRGERRVDAFVPSVWITSVRKAVWLLGLRGGMNVSWGCAGMSERRR